MKQKKVLFIYNPVAGRGKIKDYLSDIIDMLVKRGYEVIIHPTQSVGDAATVIKNIKENVDVIICSGGDGTLNEVVSGMMKRKMQIPIGYIPMGSTNDFAQSLGLPIHPEKAATVITEGNSFLCDIGKIDEDFFVYVAAFGLFTDVSYETNQQLKNSFGHMAYIMEALKRLSQIESVHCCITCNDEIIEDDFIIGMISNSTSVGGIKGITGKDIELDDGLFEVIFIKMPKNPLDVSSILHALTKRDFSIEPIFYQKTNMLTISMDKEIAWTLDGEFGGKRNHVKIENIAKAIEFKIPDMEKRKP